MPFYRKNAGWPTSSITACPTVAPTTKGDKLSITNTESIEFINDRHMDNDKPKSIRINHFVWVDWKEFTNERKSFSNKELVSMALK